MLNSPGSPLAGGAVAATSSEPVQPPVNLGAQTLWNSASILASVGLQAINTLFLFPWLFRNKPDFWGFLQFVHSLCIAAVPILILGLHRVLIRYLPNSEPDVRRSILGYSFVATACSLTVSVILVVACREPILAWLDKDQLNEYFAWVVAACCAFCLTELFASLSRANFDSVRAMAYKEISLRLSTTILLVAFGLGWIGIIHFIYCTLCVYWIMLALQFYHAKRRGYIQVGWSGFSKVRSGLLRFQGFAVLSGGAALTTTRIDQLMVGHMLSFEQLAYYGLAFMLGHMITIPQRSLFAIATPVIAGHWTRGEVDKIESLYKKSALNQMLICGFLFVLLAVNLPDLLSMLPPRFQHVTVIVLIVGFGKLFDVSTGINGGIISNTRLYQYDFWLSLVHLVTTVGLNALMIPHYGIIGAAVATASALIFYNLLKVAVVYGQLKIHPFMRSMPKLMLLLLVCGAFGWAIQLPLAPWLMLFLRSFLVGGLFLFACQRLALSQEFDGLCSRLWNRMRRKRA